MATSAKIGYGATFKWGANFVAELTRVSPLGVTTAKQDATTLDSLNSYKDFLPGLLDPGDIELEGWFRPDDTAQAAIWADMEAFTSRTIIIAFPTALSTTTWTATAYIVAFAAGELTPEGIIPFTATVGVVGQPTLGVTAAGDATNIELVGDITANMVEVPTFAGATYEYTVVGTADNTFTIEVTAAAADDITLNVDGGADQALTTGVVSSAINTASGDIVVCVIRVSEDGKSDKTYTVRVSDGV